MSARAANSSLRSVLTRELRLGGLGRDDRGVPSWLAARPYDVAGRRVIRTPYWNPSGDSAVTGQLVSEVELRNLFGRILELSSGGGILLWNWFARMVPRW